MSDIYVKSGRSIIMRLKELKQELRDTEARFRRFDNHEDMEEIAILGREIAILEWVLNETDQVR